MQPFRIRSAEWVRADVSVCVYSAYESDWIALYIFSSRWIKISHVILLQPRLSIEDLSRKPEVVVEIPCARRISIGCIRAEGVGIPGPQGRIVAWAGDFTGRVELVGVDIVDRDGRSAGSEGGDWDVAEPDGLLEQGTGGIVLAQDMAGLVVGVEDGTVHAA